MWKNIVIVLIIFITLYSKISKVYNPVVVVVVEGFELNQKFKLIGAIYSIDYMHAKIYFYIQCGTVLLNIYNLDCRIDENLQ